MIEFHSSNKIMHGKLKRTLESYEV